jgi:hypothetical protein
VFGTDLPVQQEPVRQRQDSRNHVNTDRVIGDFGPGYNNAETGLKVPGGKKHYGGNSSMKNLLCNTDTDPFNKENKMLN